MTNAMNLTPTDFEGFLGAPFTQAEIDGAVATVQNAAGWHIAPQRSETITLDVDWCERVLRPPTKRLVSVEEIRDTKLDTVIDPARYSISTERGAVHKHGGAWPHGWGRIEIHMTHGYTPVPAELLPVFAEAITLARRDQTTDRQSAGPFAVRYSMSTAQAGGTLSTAAVLERYSMWSGMA